MTHHAFSLIELLVVMAIIALLSALLVAGIGGSQATAEQKSAYSFLTLIDEGLNQYRVEYGFYPPSRDNTNNLGYVLNNPHPQLPKKRSDRDFAKNNIGYPNDYLWGKVKQQHYDYQGIDFKTIDGASVNTSPIPLYDTYVLDGNAHGQALLYVYDIDGRAIHTNDDFNYDVRVTARQGFTGSFDLWSMGEDALFSKNYHLHDLSISVNTDNITATPYK